MKIPPLVIRRTRQAVEGNAMLIPKWYGVAWFDWDCDIYVYMIPPLNILAGWYQKLRFVFKRGILYKNEAYGYLKGYNHGLSLGMQEGFDRGYEEWAAKILSKID